MDSARKRGGGEQSQFFIGIHSLKKYTINVHLARNEYNSGYGSLWPPFRLLLTIYTNYKLKCLKLSHDVGVARVLEQHVVQLLHGPDLFPPEQVMFRYDIIANYTVIKKNYINKGCESF